MDIYIPITLGTTKNPDPAETIEVDQTYEEVESPNTQQTCVKENEINKELDRAKNETSQDNQANGDFKESGQSKTDSNKELDLLLEEARQELDNALCTENEQETDLSNCDGAIGNTIPEGSASSMGSTSPQIGLASISDPEPANDNSPPPPPAGDTPCTPPPPAGDTPCATPPPAGDTPCTPPPPAEDTPRCSADDEHQTPEQEEPNRDESTLEGAVGYSAPPTEPGPPDYGPGPPSYDEVMEATETYFRDYDQRAENNVNVPSSGSSEHSQEVNNDMDNSQDGSHPPSYNTLCAMLDRIAMG